MSKKIILTIFLSLSCSILFFANDSFAYYVVSETDPNAVIMSPNYYAEDDVIRVNYGTAKVKSHHFEHYDANFSNLVSESTRTSETYFDGFGLSCLGGYIVYAYDDNGNLLGSIKIVVEEGDLVSPNCQSPSYETPQEIVNQYKCAELICECIAELKGSVDAVNDTLQPIKSDVQIIKEAVQPIQQEIKDFHSEFVSDINYDLNDIDRVNLEDVKPNQNQTKYVDDNIYFNDTGDSSDDIGKLPVAPEPEDWEGVTKENDGVKDDELSKESELIKEIEKQKDSELNKDTELQKDDFNLSPEFSLDQFFADTEMTKDSTINKDVEMTKDSFIQDSQMSVTPFEQTEQYGQTNNMSKTHVYEQTNIFP